MPGRSSRRPTRQFKTLATLVLSMTLGTFFLSWVHDLTPNKSRAATALRSVPSRAGWDRIIVQTVTPAGLNRDRTIRGFNHLHVDRDGRVHESAAWRAERQDPHARGAIRIAVSVENGSEDLTPRQWRRLTELTGELQRTFNIGWDRISSERYTGGAAMARGEHERLDAMLRAR